MLPFGETHALLFFHLEVAWRLWTDVFQLFDCFWVLPPTVESFLCTFMNEDGIRKAANPLWHGVLFASLWYLWLAWNSCIFNSKNTSYSRVVGTDEVFGFSMGQRAWILS